LVRIKNEIINITEQTLRNRSLVRIKNEIINIGESIRRLLIKPFQRPNITAFTLTSDVMSKTTNILVQSVETLDATVTANQHSISDISIDVTKIQDIELDTQKETDVSDN
jgi:hypothetical protein